MKPYYRFVTVGDTVTISLYGLRSKGGQPVGTKTFPLEGSEEAKRAHIQQCTDIYLLQTKLPERRSSVLV